MTYPPPDDGYFGPAGPPEPPQYGYLVPTQSPYGGADPLVTPVHEGFSGWFGRVFSVLRRSWRPLLLITVVTFVAPLGTLTAVIGVLGGRLIVPAPVGSGQQPTIDGNLLGTVLLIVAVGVVVAGFAVVVAHPAAVWTITRQAAGRPAPLGEALRYGLRNSPRLFGWGLLYGLLILVGTCACIIPGLYFALAGCLYIPVALYRRGLNPIGTSFTMVNRNFGAALGRMALLIVMIYAVQLVLAIPVQVVSVESRVAGIVLSVAVQIVMAPLTLLPTIGSTLLFAELWNRQAPISVAHMDAALT